MAKKQKIYFKENGKELWLKVSETGFIFASIKIIWLHRYVALPLVLGEEIVLLSEKFDNKNKHFVKEKSGFVVEKIEVVRHVETSKDKCKKYTSRIVGKSYYGL
jgi:hypothetical protein